MVKWLVKHPAAGLLADPGLGKTGPTLKAFQVVRKAGGCHNALVVAPKRVAYMVWTHDETGELYKWDQTFGDLDVSLLHGPKKVDRLNDESDLYVINFDGLRWLIESGGLKFLMKKRGVDCLIIDELSKFKNSRTKRFKAMKPWIGRFVRRWGLTGSPAPNGLIDLFGQMYMLDMGKALGQYVSRYRTKYFFPSGYGGYTWKLQDGAEKKIYKALKPLALSQSAEDHLDLPKLVIQNIWVNLPSTVRKHYEQVENDYLTLVEDETVIAVNAAVASGKCRQIASGGIYAEDPTGEKKVKGERKVIHFHDEKTKALKELVGELQGSPLLVAYEFHHDLERIRGELGKDVPAINGRTTDKKASQLVKAWNLGVLPILCGHPASMGHGLNLQNAGNHVCWYSLTWDFELYDQTIRRVYRQGVQNKRVIVHRILARDTVDADIAQAVEGKKRRQTALIDALKRRVRARKKK
jgi:SNF2 family DNA or RNA helicase